MQSMIEVKKLKISGRAPAALDRGVELLDPVPPLISRVKLAGKPRRANRGPGSPAKKQINGRGYGPAANRFRSAVDHVLDRLRGERLGRRADVTLRG